MNAVALGLRWQYQRRNWDPAQDFIQWSSRLSMIFSRAAIKAKHHVQVGLAALFAFKFDVDMAG